MLTEPGRPALTTTRTAGHDPRHPLTEAARHRELDSAGSVSDVLIWRLHRLAGLTGERPARQNCESSTRPAASVSNPSQAKTRRDALEAMDLGQSGGGLGGWIERWSFDVTCAVRGVRGGSSFEPYSNPLPRMGRSAASVRFASGGEASHNVSSLRHALTTGQRTGEGETDEYPA